jgi:tRNA1(Val) A37 N6-methylase TrmN6
VAADGDVSLDALTADVEVFQRRRGHRFSSDDTVTAWVAMQVCPAPRRVLDLGCGIGSVLLHLAWCAPAATLVGVEAQAVSFALAQRNVAHNRLGGRVTVHHGDLREPAVVAALEAGGPFDLVTGTPPYFPVAAARPADDEQREYARIEHRGGIEAYTRTAAQLVADGSWFVVCGDADAGHRADAAAAEHGFAVHRHDVVLPRAGRPPLFAVWAMRRGAAPTARERRVITLRDADGNRTADARALRAFSGFPERA